MLEPSTTAKPPNPGSPEAVARGCTCPVMDNCRGAGVMGDGERNGWWMVEGCPLHGAQDAGEGGRDADR